MNKKILLIICSFFICTNVFALDACTTSELQRLNELASNVEFKKEYEIDEEDGEVSLVYNVKVINFDKDLKIIYRGQFYDDDVVLKSGEELEDAFYEGSYVNFNIYAYSTNLCSGKLLKTVRVSFPTYNDYYYFNKDKCQENPDFKYCKEYMDVSEVDFSKIDKEFQEYLEDKNKIVKLPTDNKNLYIIVGSGVIVVLIVIIIIAIIVKKRRKEDL